MGMLNALNSWISDDLHLDITYCDNQLVMNESEVWTYVIIPGEPLGIATDETIDDHQDKVHTLLEGFRDTDFHYYKATLPFDTAGWLANILENQERESQALGFDPAPAFRSHIERQALALQERKYKRFVTYLGIKLGTRRKILDEVVSQGDSAIKTWLTKGKRFVEQHSGGVDPQPTKREIAMWTKKAKETHARFARNEAIQARPATKEQMWSLLWHIASLGINADSTMGTTTEKWGSGEIRTLAPEMDTRSPNYLSFSRVNPTLLTEYRHYQTLLAQHEADPAQVPLPTRPEPMLDGYATVLSAQMPDEVGKAWIFNTTTTEFSVDTSVRFRIKSVDTARREARRAQEQARQAKNHQEESGIPGGTVATAKTYETAKAHADRLETGVARTQIDFKARLIVHGENRDEVLANTQALIQSYSEEEKVVLHWIAGAQETLYKECVPGQVTRPFLHDHKADIQAFTNGLPFSSLRLGYETGFYIGAFQRQPFLFDPSRSAREGKSPAILFSGSLGGGKTVAMMIYVDLFRLRNYHCILIDPKRDLRSLLALHGRGHTRVWNLTTDGRPGILDPFTMFSPEVDPSDPERDTPAKAYEKWREETHGVVMDTIQRTLGQDLYRDPDMSSILTAVVTTEMARNDEAGPSMAGLLARFEAGEIGYATSELEALNATREQISSMRITAKKLHQFLLAQASNSRGRLIYGRRDEDDALLIGNVKTTIIDVSGLDLPEDDIPSEDYTTSHRISQTLFSLATSYAQRVLENPRIMGPKGLLVDEYHMIKNLPAMGTMARRSNRMGRSYNIIPMYADQSAGAARENTAFTNSIGARVVFRSDRTEAEGIAQAMDRPGDQELINSIPSKDDATGKALHTTPADSSVPGSKPGVGIVSFDRNYSEEYRDAFETNDLQIEGWTRAAYRHYPLDSNGVHYDPLSPRETIGQPIPDPDPTEPVVPDHDRPENLDPNPPGSDQPLPESSPEGSHERTPEPASVSGGATAGNSDWLI